MRIMSEKFDEGFELMPIRRFLMMKQEQLTDDVEKFYPRSCMGDTSTDIYIMWIWIDKTKE